MTASRYTGVSSSQVTGLLDETLREIGNEIEELRLPKLAAVVLGGGYGRGEGGVLRTQRGERLYNDLDFFVFSSGGARRENERIQEELSKVSERWGKALGIAVDFSPVKKLASLHRVSQTLMYQELLHGWVPVWGTVDLEKWIPALRPEELPFSEAARLLLNRGMGLMLAGEYLKAGKDDADFVVRNLNKAILGCGDAFLLAAGQYRWRGQERVKAFRVFVQQRELPEEYAASYEDAFHFKLEPVPELPDSPWERWRFCRSFFMETVCRLAGVVVDAPSRAVVAGLHRAVRKERSCMNLLRWLLRARGWRPFGMALDPPVVSVLSQLYEEIRQADNVPAYSSGLYRLWQIFN